MIEKLAFWLCILGALISAYLLQSKILGSELLCGVSSCGVVNNSQYSQMFGIPISALGFLFYMGMAVLITLGYKRLFFLGSIVGLLFSAYLTYIEAFVIYAWCQWCIMSAWISFSLFFCGMRAALFKRAASI